jgi:hypothetical protein
MGLPKEVRLLVNLWKIKSWLKFFGKVGQMDGHGEVG